MNRQIPFWINVVQRHLNNFPNSILIHLMHTERLDIVLFQDALLPGINITQTDVHELLDADAVFVFEPAERRVGLVGCKTREEGDGHAVDVAAVGGFGGVDVGVCVDPDDSHLTAQALSDRLGCAADGADCDAVVSAESQDEAAFLGVVVDLFAEGFGDGADGPGLQHVAVRGIGLGHELVI